MNFLFDMLIPRFVTEYVALEDRFGEFVIRCSARDILAFEHVDAVAKVRALSLFNFGFFPKIVGEVITDRREIERIIREEKGPESW